MHHLLELDSPTLQPEAQAEAARFVAEMDARSVKFHTPCGAGQMVWRRWGSGSPVVMMHGGAGAWSHWIRNIDALAQHYTVWTPDTPGLGESATPEPADLATLCRTVEQGAAQLIPEGQVDVVGFSMGSRIAASLALSFGPRLRHLVLSASRFVRGFDRKYPELVSPRKLEKPIEKLAAHRRNLQIMMIANPENIDALAVHVQSTNTARRRVVGKHMQGTTTLLFDCLHQVQPQGRVTGISGSLDQAAVSIMDQQEAALHELMPAARFHAIEGAGHWVQYEAAPRYNELLLAALD